MQTQIKTQQDAKLVQIRALHHLLGIYLKDAEADPEASIKGASECIDFYSKQINPAAWKSH